jgi:hypothetical protein
MSFAAVPAPKPIGARSLALATAGAIALSAALAGSTGDPTIALPAPGARASSPPPIVANAGQADPRVRFQASAGNGTLFFTAREIVLAHAPGVVRLRFDGANPAPTLRAEDRGPGVINDLRGRDPDRWRTSLPIYGAVAYGGLYPGVDLRVAADTRAGTPWIRPTYSVAAHAQPNRIRWRYPGTASVGVDPRSGDLLVAASGGAGAVLREAAPVAWQRAGASRVAVKADYHVAADGTVGFALGRYDRSRPLVLTVPPRTDAAQSGPPRLAYSTFLGGTKWDEAYDVAADRRGNAYVAGFTFSSEFPRAGSRASRFRGVVDAFVSRLGPDGRLVYSSYLGGSGTDAAHGVAVDRRGNAYVTGRTESTDFPQRNALQRRVRGRGCQGEPCHDAFVTKLGRRGGLVYSTYLGGSGNEEAWDIAVDRAGRAHVIGNTDSTNFPTRRAVQGDNRSRPCAGDVPCPFDLFITKLRPNGRRIAYSTYLGGRKSELASGIAIDRAGSAYVTGNTDSTDFPVRRAMQRAVRGRLCGPPPNVPCEDAFVAKLAPRGRSLRWSTYLGGAKPERGTAIAVDRRGRAYVSGTTQSTDFPTARPVQAAIGNSSCSAEAPPKEACDDGFVTALSRNGRRLRFSTYLGGNAEDQALAIGVDPTGSVYTAGSTDSRTFPTANPLQGSLAAGIDGFVTKLNPGGRSIAYSTYLGGAESERVNSLAIAPTGGIIATGRTDSPDFPVAAAQQGTLAGDIDAFVTRLR